MDNNTRIRSRTPAALNWFRNVGKSLGYTTTELVERMMPASIQFVTSNKEAAQEAYRELKEAKSQGKKVTDFISNNEQYKIAATAVKNAIEDIKSGNIYNKERQEKVYETDDEFSMEDFEFDDSDDFGLDDEKDKETISIKKSVTKVEAPSMENDVPLAKAIDRQTDVLVKSSAASDKLMVTVASNTIMSSGKIGENNISALRSLNDNLSLLVNFQSESMTKYIGASLKYYEDNLKVLNDTLEVIKKTQDPAGFSATDKKVSENPLDNILLSKGGLDIRGYGQMVWKQVQNAIDTNMFLAPVKDFLSDEDTLKYLAASPLSFISTKIVSTLIPNMLKSAMEDMDKTFQSFFPAMLMKINRWANKSDNPILQLIGQVFGVNVKTKGSVDLSTYNKGAVPFDGYTRKSITDVIPTYLRKILAVLSGNEEMGFDYEKGTFQSVFKMKEEFENKKDRTALDQFSDVMGELKDKINFMDIRDTEDKSNFFKEMEKFFLSLSKTNYLVNPELVPDKDGNVVDELKEVHDFGGNEAYQKLFRQLIMSLPKHQRMEMFGRSVLDARAAREQLMVDAEQNPLKYNASTIFSMLGLDEHITRDKKNASKFTLKGGGTGSALGSFDKYGHSDLDYLRDIKKILLDGIIVFPQYDQGPTVSNINRIGFGNPPSGGGQTGPSNRIGFNMSGGSSTGEQGSLDLGSSGQNDSTFDSTVSFNRMLDERRKSQWKMQAEHREFIRKKWKTRKFKEATPEEVTRNLQHGQITVNSLSDMESSPDELQDMIRRIDDERERRVPADQDNNITKWIGKFFEGGAQEKYNMIREKVENLIHKPAEILTQAFKKIDSTLYYLVFGKKDDDYNKSIFGVTLAGIKEKFSEWTDWFKKEIFEPMKEYLFGENGLFKRIQGSDFYKSLFGKLKGMGNYLFGSPNAQGLREGGLFSDTANEFGDMFRSFKYYFTGRGYTDSKGQSFGDNTESVFGEFKNIMTGLKDNIKLYLFGNKPKSGEIGEDGEKGVLTGLFSSVKQGFQNFSDAIFGPKEIGGKKNPNYVAMDEMMQTMKARAPKALAWGMTGAGAGLLLGGKLGLLGSVLLPGGPIGGAIVGTALGFLGQSDSFKNWLFGEKDEKGDRKGGFISKKHLDFLKKHKAGIIGGAALGALKSTLGFGLLPSFMLPGGPLGAAVLGAAVSMGVRSEKFQNFVFGKKGEDGKRTDGIIQKIFGGLKTGKNKHLFGNIGAGAIGGATLGLIGQQFGLMGSLFLGGGPIMGALLGTAAGIALTSEKWKKVLFGEFDEDTQIRKGGIFGRFVNWTKLEIFQPLKLKMSEIGLNIEEWFVKSIANPFKDALAPIKYEIKLAIKSIQESIKQGWDQFKSFLGNTFEKFVGQPFGKFMKEKVLDPLKSFFWKILSGGAKIVGSVLSAPFKGLLGLSQGLTAKHKQQGIDNEVKSIFDIKGRRDRRERIDRVISKYNQRGKDVPEWIQKEREKTQLGFFGGARKLLGLYLVPSERRAAQERGAPYLAEMEAEIKARDERQNADFSARREAINRERTSLNQRSEVAQRLDYDNLGVDSQGNKVDVRDMYKMHQVDVDRGTEQTVTPQTQTTSQQTTSQEQQQTVTPQIQQTQTQQQPTQSSTPQVKINSMGERVTPSGIILPESSGGKVRSKTSEEEITSAKPQQTKEEPKTETKTTPTVSVASPVTSTIQSGVTALPDKSVFIQMASDMKIVAQEVKGQLNGVGSNVFKIRKILQKKEGVKDEDLTGSANRDRDGILSKIRKALYKPLDSLKTAITKPFVWVGKKITAVGTAISKTVTAVLKIPAAIAKGVWGFVKEVGSIAKEGVKVLFQLPVEAVKIVGGVISSFAEGIKAIAPAVGESLKGVAKLFSGAMGFASEALVGFGKGMGSLLYETGKGIGEVVSGIGGAIGWAIKSTTQALFKAVPMLTEFVFRAGETIVDFTFKTVKMVGEKLLDVGSALFSIVTSPIKFVGQMFNKMFSSTSEVKVVGGSIDLIKEVDVVHVIDNKTPFRTIQPITQQPATVTNNQQNTNTQTQTNTISRQPISDRIFGTSSSLGEPVPVEIVGVRDICIPVSFCEDAVSHLYNKFTQKPLPVVDQQLISSQPTSKATTTEHRTVDLDSITNNIPQTPTKGTLVDQFGNALTSSLAIADKHEDKEDAEKQTDQEKEKKQAEVSKKTAGFMLAESAAKEEKAFAMNNELQQTSYLKRIADSFSQHKKDWSEIFGKKGLITAGLILAIPFIIKLLKKLLGKDDEGITQNLGENLARGVAWSMKGIVNKAIFPVKKAIEEAIHPMRKLFNKFFPKSAEESGEKLARKAAKEAEKRTAKELAERALRDSKRDAWEKGIKGEPKKGFFQNLKEKVIKPKATPTPTISLSNTMDNIATATEKLEMAAGKNVSKSPAGIILSESSGGKARSKMTYDLSTKAPTASIASETVERVAIESADNIMDSTKASQVDNVMKTIKDMMEKIFKILEKKCGKNVKSAFTKIMGKVNKVFTKKLILKTLPKWLGGIAKIAGSASTLFLSDAAWATWGAISGGVDAAHLFKVHPDQVDGFMRVISSAMNALLNVSWFFLIQIANDIFFEFTGIDFIQMLATSAYGALAGDLKHQKLKDAQTTFEDDAKAAGMSLTAYNDMINETLGAKIGKGVKKGWDATKNFASKTWDATTNVAGKVWTGTKNFASATWDVTKKAASATWGGVKKGAKLLKNTVWSSQEEIRSKLGLPADESFETTAIDRLSVQSANALEMLTFGLIKSEDSAKVIYGIGKKASDIATSLIKGTGSFLEGAFGLKSKEEMDKYRAEHPILGKLAGAVNWGVEIGAKTPFGSLFNMARSALDEDIIRKDLGMTKDQEVNWKDRVSATLGAGVESVTFGLISSESASKFFHNFGKGTVSFTKQLGLNTGQFIASVFGFQSEEERSKFQKEHPILSKLAGATRYTYDILEKTPIGFTMNMIHSAFKPEEIREALGMGPNEELNWKDRIAGIMGAGVESLTFGLVGSDTATKFFHDTGKQVVDWTKSIGGGVKSLITTSFGMPSDKDKKRMAEHPILNFMGKIGNYATEVAPPTFLIKNMARLFKSEAELRKELGIGDNVKLDWTDRIEFAISKSVEALTFGLVKVNTVFDFFKTISKTIDGFVTKAVDVGKSALNSLTGYFTKEATDDINKRIEEWNKTKKSIDEQTGKQLTPPEVKPVETVTVKNVSASEPETKTSFTKKYLSPNVQDDEYIDEDLIDPTLRGTAFAMSLAKGGSSSSDNNRLFNRKALKDRILKKNNGLPTENIISNVSDKVDDVPKRTSSVGVSDKVNDATKRLESLTPNIEKSPSGIVLSEPRTSKPREKISYDLSGKTPASNTVSVASEVSEAVSIGSVDGAVDEVKSSQVDNILKVIKDMMDKIFTLLEKKCGPSVKKAFSEIMANITKVFSPKVIMKTLPKWMQGVVKITGAASTLFISDAAWATWGAISGAVDAAYLFGVDEEDVDIYMRSISSAMTALLNVSWFFLIQIANEIFKELTGIDFLQAIAIAAYGALAGEDSKVKLEEARADFAQDAAKAGMTTDDYNKQVNKTLGSKIGDSVSAAWEGTKNVASSAYKGLADFGKNIGIGVSDAYYAAKDTVSAAWDKTKDVASKTWESAKSAVTQSETYKGLFDDDTIRQKLGWKGDEKVGLMERVASGSSMLLENLSFGLIDSDDSIKKILWVMQKTNEAFRIVGDKISEVWESLTGYISEKWDGLTTYVSEKWEALKTNISEKWDAFKENASIVWDKFTGMLSEKWEGLKTFVHDKWTAFITPVQELWDRFTGMLSEKWEAIKTKVSEKWDSLKQSATILWDKFTGMVTEKWEGLKTLVAEKWTAFMTPMRELWDRFTGMVSEKWEAIKTVVSDKWTAFITPVQELWDRFTGMLSEKWEGVKTVVVEKWDAFMDPVKKLWESFTTTISEKWTSIKDTVFGIWDKFKTKATTMWDATVKVVTDAWDSVKTKLGEIWDGITQPLEDAWTTVKKKVDDGITKITGFFTNISDTILKPFKSVWDWFNEDVEATVERRRKEQEAKAKGGNGPIGGEGPGGFGNVPEKVNNFTYYSQNDSDWSKFRFDHSPSVGTKSENPTLGARGCGPTSMAMVATQLTGQKFEPPQMAQIAEKGGFSTNQGTSWGYFDKVAQDFSLSKVELDPKNNKTSIKSYLDQGIPIILSGKRIYGESESPFTKGGHFVVAVGMQGEDGIKINDPRGAQYSKTYSIDKVMNEAAKGWAFKYGGGPIPAPMRDLTMSPSLFVDDKPKNDWAMLDIFADAVSAFNKYSSNIWGEDSVITDWGLTESGTRQVAPSTYSDIKIDFIPKNVQEAILKKATEMTIKHESGGNYSLAKNDISSETNEAISPSIGVLQWRGGYAKKLFNKIYSRLPEDDEAKRYATQVNWSDPKPWSDEDQMKLSNFLSRNSIIAKGVQDEMALEHVKGTNLAQVYKYGVMSDKLKDPRSIVFLSDFANTGPALVSKFMEKYTPTNARGKEEFDHFYNEFKNKSYWGSKAIYKGRAQGLYNDLVNWDPEQGGYGEIINKIRADVANSNFTKEQDMLQKGGNGDIETGIGSDGITRTYSSEFPMFDKETAADVRSYLSNSNDNSKEKLSDELLNKAIDILKEIATNTSTTSDGIKELANKDSKIEIINTIPSTDNDDKTTQKSNIIVTPGSSNSINPFIEMANNSRDSKVSKEYSIAKSIAKGRIV